MGPARPAQCERKGGGGVNERGSNNNKDRGGGQPLPTRVDEKKNGREGSPSATAIPASRAEAGRRQLQTTLFIRKDGEGTRTKLTH